MVFKCKMCGGDLEVQAGSTVAECLFCGTQQTLPGIDDEQRANLFNRANHFRRIGEFDKAVAAYERILQDDANDAEAHWGAVISRFGIEYVEDPGSRQRIPTCHRVQVQSILADDDYLAAVELAPDSLTKDIYIKEASRISDVQKGILAISRDEEPYDVFICYKETDETGARTKDSALAQDIYYQLTNEGYKVFFARITLEDKLGTQYEPYIFAALNSAKVMLAIGTKPEYFNAVWVKNEWSRFLALMKNDSSRLLIPCYRDMDAYDLPEELSMFQSQDMGKIGFVQDLLHGVKKVLSKDKPSLGASPVVVQGGASGNVASLLKRVSLFLEDEDWTSADEYCERVLDIDPENAEAYLGKLLVERKVRSKEALVDCSFSFDTSNHYKKLMRFGSDELRQEMASLSNRCKFNIYSRSIDTADQVEVFEMLADKFNKLDSIPESSAAALHCKELAQKHRVYNEADSLTNINITDHYVPNEEDKDKLRRAEELFSSVVDVKDSKARAAECVEMMAAIVLLEQKREKYQEANELAKVTYDLGKESSLDARESLEKAMDLYVSLKGFLNSFELWDECSKKIEIIDKELASAREAAKERKRQLITLVIVAALIGALALYYFVVIPAKNYRNAKDMLQNEDYEAAIMAFSELEDYRESPELLLQAYYGRAEQYESAGDSANAAFNFGKADSYLDAKSRSFALWDTIADRAHISAGRAHTIAIKADGTVVATGLNNLGQCDVSSWSDIIAVEAGFDHSVGLRADGTVVATGNNVYGQCDVGEWTDIVVIAAGDNHTIGLKSDGTLVATGDNTYGQCYVDNLDYMDSIVEISAGSEHSVARDIYGYVGSIGSNYYGLAAAGWAEINAIEAGGNHTIGFRSDGSYVAVGRTDEGQCGLDGWYDIVSFSAGNYHTVGLRSDGTVASTWYYGDYYAGQCDTGYWNNIVELSAGANHTVGIKADGTVIATGLNGDGQCNVSEWTDIKLP